MAYTDPANIPNQNTPLNTNSSLGAEKLAQGQMWNIEVMFNNFDTQPYQMSPNIIMELAIEDDILSWPTQGYLVYQNRQEGIERNINKEAWYYRMDARDELSIKMKPIFKNSELDFPPEIWEINSKFVIYDVEDLPATNIETKAKKIYFWDKRYQMMLDKNIQWSTATTKFNTNLKNKKASQATDSERSMYTGDAIKALLKDAGFGEWIDEKNWDTGKSKILYTSPSEFSVADDLKYLLKIHLSPINNDICIFTIDRGTQKWQLLPISKMFEKAGKTANQPGDLQLEHFFFEDQLYNEGKNTAPYKAPYTREPSTKKDIKLTGYNTIDTYKFVDMSGLDNEKILNSKPVYWYDYNSKQFGADIKNNEISNVREKFKKNYVDQLLGDKPTPLFTLNKTKTEQYNVDPQFVYSSATSASDKAMRSLFGMGKILFGGLFLNECMVFRVIGSTHRLAGTFVGIDRLTGGSTNPGTGEGKFDDKICGQWFVTNVKHIWKLNKFINDVTAVKIHSYSNLNIKEDIY